MSPVVKRKKLGQEEIGSGVNSHQRWYMAATEETLGLIFIVQMVGRLRLGRHSTPGQQAEYCRRNAQHMQVEVEQIPRVPSALREQRAERIPLGEERARETEAEDRSGGLDNPIAEKLHTSGHVGAQSLLQAALVL